MRATIATAVRATIEIPDPFDHYDPGHTNRTKVLKLIDLLKDTGDANVNQPANLRTAARLADQAITQQRNTPVANRPLTFGIGL